MQQISEAWNSSAPSNRLYHLMKAFGCSDLIAPVDIKFAQRAAEVITRGAARQKRYVRSVNTTGEDRLGRLADDLIELRCGRHSVGNVYTFLVEAYGDADRAKGDFIRFLSGELSEHMLQTAADWIAGEQRERTQIAAVPKEDIACRW